MLLVGHSSGGAFALIAAALLEARGINASAAVFANCPWTTALRERRAPRRLRRLSGEGPLQPSRAFPEALTVATAAPTPSASHPLWSCGCSMHVTLGRGTRHTQVWPPADTRPSLLSPGPLRPGRGVRRGNRRLARHVLRLGRGPGRRRVLPLLRGLPPAHHDALHGPRRLHARPVPGVLHTTFLPPQTSLNYGSAHSA